MTGFCKFWQFSVKTALAGAGNNSPVGIWSNGGTTWITDHEANKGPTPPARQSKVSNFNEDG